ncbi:MAG: hypothetical protein K2K97_09505 [Muribaculaceae bacterium]|nr:hypothetical protein [Muribaculaceae bacterium]
MTVAVETLNGYTVETSGKTLNDLVDVARSGVVRFSTEIIVVCTIFPDICIAEVPNSTGIFALVEVRTLNKE